MSLSLHVRAGVGGRGGGGVVGKGEGGGRWGVKHTRTTFSSVWLTGAGGGGGGNVSSCFACAYCWRSASKPVVRPFVSVVRLPIACP